MIEQDLSEGSLLQTFTLIFFLLGISFLMAWIAWKRDFFKPLPFHSALSIKGLDVFEGFAFFLTAELFIFPLFVFILLETHVVSLNPSSRTWLNLIPIYGGALAVWVFYQRLTSLQKHNLWQQTSVHRWQSIKTGLLGLAVFYFPAMLISYLISLMIGTFSDHAPKDQIAIEFLRQVKEYPLQLIMSIVAITILAPLKEEFLFRGLLQTWLKQKFHSTTPAILLTSLIFALFHFAGAQALSNIPLLCALFFLSCGLGYVFEKEGSLWASVALHAGFNSLQIVLFLVTEGTI